MVWELGKHRQRQLDRISGMSDDILGEIFSFLPIKEAVATRVLSKRWQHAWTLIGAVQIRDRDLFQSYYDAPDTRKQRISQSFLSFVGRVFNHVMGLRKLELDCNHFYVEQWIDIVTHKLNAHAASLCELDLTLSGPTSMFHRVRLPPKIFTSRSLEILKLSFEVEQLILQSSSTVFCLPRLKVLHIKTFEVDLSCLENLLSGCPVLEELFMNGGKHSEENKHQVLRINSSSLKRLILRLPFFTRVDIDAPNLEELVFRVEEEVTIVNSTLPSLTSLTIDISPIWMEDPTSHHYGVLSNAFIETLAKAPNTRYLFLRSYTLRYLFHDNFYEQLPPLPNYLMDLKLEIFYANWPLAAWFLRTVPDLVSFSIRVDRSEEYIESEGDNDIVFDEGILDLFAPPPTDYSLMPNLHHHLEKVELEDFQGKDYEMDLVTYLLEKSPVLKKLTLLYGTHDQIDVASRLYNKIVMLPKASSTCEFNVLFYDSMSGHYVPQPYLTN